MPPLADRPSDRLSPSITPPIRDVDRAEILAVVVLAVILFVMLRIPCAAMPLERDEGEYAYTAQRMLHGEVPYRHVFDQKPPGVFLVYLIPVALLGASVTAIHVTLYFWTAAAAAFVFLVAKELADRRAGAYALVVFSVITILPVWLGTAANTEHFMLLPMTAGIWCALRARATSRPTWWFAAGALGMAACWFKQIALANLVFVVGYMLVVWSTTRSTRGLRGLAVDVTALGLGVAVLAAPVPIYFAVRGAWHEFMDAVFLHNLQYSGSVGFKEGMETFQIKLGAQSTSLWLIWLLVAVGVGDPRRLRRRSSVWLLTWLMACAVGLSVGMRFYEHYFIYLAPVFAVAAGRALAGIVQILGKGTGIRPGWAAAVVVGVLGVAPSVVAEASFFFATSPREKVARLYVGNPFDVSQEIAAYLAAHTTPNERILIFGSEPQILFYAQRPSATRYIIFYPLMLVAPDSEARQRGVWEEVRKAGPKYVLMTDLAASLLPQPGSSSFLYDKVVAMLDTEYSIEGVRIYEGAGYRMLFGDEARRILEDVQSGRSQVHLDMFVMARK